MTRDDEREATRESVKPIEGYAHNPKEWFERAVRRVVSEGCPMADVDGEFVSVSVDADVATITLQRPPMNALNATVQEEIRQAAEVVSEDASIGAVIVYGGPKVFAAGAVLGVVAGFTAPAAGEACP